MTIMTINNNDSEPADQSGCDFLFISLIFSSKMQNLAPPSFFYLQFRKEMMNK